MFLPYGVAGFLSGKVGLSVSSEFIGRFPTVTFRKKRLTVAIHTQFDMQNAVEMDATRLLIEEALSRLCEEGEAKIFYTVSDV
jgi:hypothetical protein